MRMRALQPGYLLHRRPYREHSLLLELLTRDRGRIGLVARGARRPRAARPTCPWQPFQPLCVTWSGRGELKNLNHVEAAAPAVMLPARACLAGMYVNELLLALLHRQDPCPGLYAAYRDVIGTLRAAAAQPATHVAVEPALRGFEMALLSELGYGMVLERDWRTGEPVRPDRDYYYKVEHGPSLEDPGGECMRVRGATLCGMVEGGGDAAGGAAGERRRLLRYNLRHHLGGREPASREAYRALLRLGAGAAGPPSPPGSAP